MVGIEHLKKVYAEKLLKTGSHDEAFTKACWVAYLRGLDDAKEIGINETGDSGTAQGIESTART